MAVYFSLYKIQVVIPLLLAYLIYLYLDPTPEMGGRQSKWFRNLALWRNMRDYFPARLVKTAELDPSKNYVFGYHPHGIIGLGAFINFGTDANSFTSMFRGISVHLLTLDANFFIPLARDVLLFLGICSASQKSCNNILTMQPGSSIMIVLGGAQESTLAFPNTNGLILKKRFGFVKIALANGASLVPVFSFGENDIWDQLPNPKGSMLQKFQDFTRKTLTFVPPAIYGRGLFSEGFGLMPHRRPITSVVGAPIECPKVENPSRELVLEYQLKYIQALENLYHEHKHKYLPNRVEELKFVE
ncbi:Diacylglycerol O-acyltransferase 2 [Boothiomyces macroporosus]|uniref:Diacylglycerol O-acyltransferase n=1 Tax=Boothiomyces macroporosus TaxID=261099 RepID=A0AAD5UM42_9FUNG|nr:Diacylglycerol O-acyltransferase 2 [Boothiomyces macroporosus]